MILVNTTFSVDSSISADFIDFIKETYLPLAESSGFYAPLLTELRAPSEPDADGNPQRTFALQMRAPSQKTVTDFRNDILPHIYGSMSKLWGMKLALFESTLDVVHDPAKHN